MRAAPSVATFAIAAVALTAYAQEDDELGRILDRLGAYFFSSAAPARACVRGVATVQLEFEEVREPTLVRAADGGNLWTHGSVWVERETGSLHRVAIAVGPDAPGAFRRLQAESQMRVEFAREDALDLLVPSDLVENFWIRNGRGEGRARYSNYRRYRTSARILPPQSVPR